MGKIAREEEKGRLAEERAGSEGARAVAELAKCQDQIKKLDKGRNYCTEDEWNAGLQDPSPASSELNYRKFGSDLHYVLQDKCEDSEGFARIRAAGGDGIKAYFSM